MLHCNSPILTSPMQLASTNRVPVLLGRHTKFTSFRLHRQSIVMSMPVCPQAISGTTSAIFTNFFVRVSYVRGSVLLRHDDDRPHRLSAGRDDGSAQRARSVIYDCLISNCDTHARLWSNFTFSLLLSPCHTVF